MRGIPKVIKMRSGSPDVPAGEGPGLRADTQCFDSVVGDAISLPTRAFKCMNCEIDVSLQIFDEKELSDLHMVRIVTTWMRYAFSSPAVAPLCAANSL